MKDIPVYLFTGFLEAGKTKFIQESMEDARVNNGERTLILLCEEGVEELDPSAFASSNVWIAPVENEENLTPDTLQKLLDAHRCERVIVEYNGMWQLNTLYQQMPENWVVAQEYLFCDANTFLSYNTNMRQLVYDKLRSCELVVFNRCGDNIDRMELHKIVRAASRRTDIAYEKPDGTVEYDEIEDPLPFDLDAPVVDISDRDYALFYSDLSEDFRKYDGKTLHYKGMVVKSARLADDCFIFGRQLMTCCANDIQFTGLAASWPHAKELGKGQWVDLTAKVTVKWHKAYGKKGPVLNVTKLEPTEPPAEPVATFY
ncbi:MAG: GTP-binding protein [Oscillospiraceae bacterium]